MHAPALESGREIPGLGPAPAQHGRGHGAERAQRLDRLLLPAGAARLAVGANRVGRAVKDRPHFVRRLSPAVLGPAVQRLIQLAKSCRRLVGIATGRVPDTPDTLGRIPPHGCQAVSGVLPDAAGHGRIQEHRKHALIEREQEKRVVRPDEGRAHARNQRRDRKPHPPRALKRARDQRRQAIDTGEECPLPDIRIQKRARRHTRRRACRAAAQIGCRQNQRIKQDARR